MNDTFALRHHTRERAAESLAKRWRVMLKRWRSLTSRSSEVDVSCLLPNVLMEGKYSADRGEENPSLSLNPPDKLHNNHPVSGLPPGLRFQFCAAVPRRSHELTLKFCSGRRGSGSAVAPLWQLASQTISERVRDCTAAQESITASHLRLFPRGAALHERWSTGSL